jgi:hypothetical protein
MNLKSWYKRGKQVAASVNTASHIIGPGLHEFLDLGVLGRGNEVFWSVGCISLYIVLFLDNKKW